MVLETGGGDWFMVRKRSPPCPTACKQTRPVWLLVADSLLVLISFSQTILSFQHRTRRKHEIDVRNERCNGER